MTGRLILSSSRNEGRKDRTDEIVTRVNTFTHGQIRNIQSAKEIIMNYESEISNPLFQ